MNKSRGCIYLIPTPLGAFDRKLISTHNLEIIRSLDIFIVERSKTARAFIKSCNHPKPQSALQVFEFNNETSKQELQEMLKHISEGNNIGLMSEAGCPCVADPGYAVVRLCHEMSINVVPLVGASSIMMALMASGLNGQSFVFHGYLTPKTELLAGELLRLEKAAHSLKQTQIFIETPYRNNKLFQTLITTLHENTLVGVAANLTQEGEWTRTLSIKKWKTETIPDLNKIPAIFMVGG